MSLAFNFKTLNRFCMYVSVHFKIADILLLQSLCLSIPISLYFFSLDPKFNAMNCFDMRYSVLWKIFSVASTLNIQTKLNYMLNRKMHSITFILSILCFSLLFSAFVGMALSILKLRLFDAIPDDGTKKTLNFLTCTHNMNTKCFCPTNSYLLKIQLLETKLTFIQIFFSLPFFSLSKKKY